MSDEKRKQFEEAMAAVRNNHAVTQRSLAHADEIRQAQMDVLAVAVYELSDNREACNSLTRMFICLRDGLPIEQWREYRSTRPHGCSCDPNKEDPS